MAIYKIAIVFFDGKRIYNYFFDKENLFFYY